jgi:hypothetical protein
MIKKLGLKEGDNDKKVDLDFYEHYGIKGSFDERIMKGGKGGGYTFQNVLKNSSKLATKNQKEFKEYLKEQKQFYEKVKKMNS